MSCGAFIVIGIAVGFVAGIIFTANHPPPATIDDVLCEDRCSVREEKLLTVASRECICTTTRIALPGRSSK